MIPSLIHQILNMSGLKQQGLADIMGVKLQRVKRLAGGGVQKMTREESEALVRKLNIRADWLLTGEGSMFEENSCEKGISAAPSSLEKEGDLGPSFMGKVLEEVMDAYAACSARISTRNAGEQAMWIYKDIQSALGASADLKEREGALKMEIYRLKQKLSRPASQAEGKRSA